MQRAEGNWVNGDEEPVLLSPAISHSRLLLSLRLILGKIPCFAPGSVTLLSIVPWISALDKDLEEGKQRKP